MAMTDKDYEWLDKIRSELEQGGEAIDAATRSRLARIRRQALGRKSSSRLVPFGLPAAALATACLVLAIIIYVPDRQTDRNEVIDDLDLITNSESLELYEDLEFYEWLEVYDLPG